MTGADDDEFATFMRDAEPRLRRALVAAFGSQRGRDATAEGLAWAWEHWADVRDMANPVGYLYRVGRSRTRDRRRPIVFARDDTPEPWVEPRLATALASLSERQRLAVVLVVGAVVTVARSRHTTAVPLVEATTTTTAATTVPNVAPIYRYAVPTGDYGVIGPGRGWRIDGYSFSRTDDDGHMWQDITPPNAVSQDPIARINWVDVLDSQHVWAPVAVNHAPFTIYRSDDGGTTWVAACVGAGCAASAQATFLDRDHGWGIDYGPGGDLNGGTISSTSDGGHTWKRIGPVPFIGPMHFLDLDHGWGVSDPSGYGGRSALATKGGGDLYRTDDGGRTWMQFSPDIGGRLHFGVPQWFGNDGVVVGWSEPNSESGHHDQVRVYTTHDGGNTWAGQVAPPSDDATDRYGNAPQLLAPDFPFSASSPTDWMLFIGPKLYVTHDAGAHWDTLTPAPAISRVFSLEATSASSAWAQAFVPICDHPDPPRQSCRLEILVRTTDGGRSWPAVPTPAAPSP